MKRILFLSLSLLTLGLGACGNGAMPGVPDDTSVVNHVPVKPPVPPEDVSHKIGLGLTSTTHQSFDSINRTRQVADIEISNPFVEKLDGKTIELCLDGQVGELKGAQWRLFDMANTTNPSHVLGTVAVETGGCATALVNRGPGLGTGEDSSNFYDPLQLHSRPRINVGIFLRLADGVLPLSRNYHLSVKGYFVHQGKEFDGESTSTKVGVTIEQK